MQRLTESRERLEQRCCHPARRPVQGRGGRKEEEQAEGDELWLAEI